MRILLDTHALIWFLLNDPQLSATARAAITNPANTVYLSPASYWEIAIKLSTGKLAIGGPYEDTLRQAILNNSFALLPIEIQHTALLVAMPYHHRDPFDRLLIAQAQAEGIPIVSNETLFDAYGVSRIW